LPLYHLATISLCHYITLPLYQFATISLCHYITLPLYHFATISLCHYITLPLYHLATISLCHYITLPLYQFATISLCHYITLPTTNLQVRKLLIINIKLFPYIFPFLVNKSLNFTTLSFLCFQWFLLVADQVVRISVPRFVVGSCIPKILEDICLKT